MSKKDFDFGQIVKPLLSWYQNAKRSLPWRDEPTPYRVWVSEIMLQQTRVEAVKEYYLRFMQELPTVQALAECEEEKLLKLWEGLGYYSRVRNLQKAAKTILSVYGGEFPADVATLSTLSGIGSYTAGGDCFDCLWQASGGGGRQRFAGCFTLDGKSNPYIRRQI